MTMPLALTLAPPNEPPDRNAWTGRSSASAPTPEPNSVVAVVDDDPMVLDTIGSLLETVGLKAELFNSVGAFLNAGGLDRADCLVLDVRLPGRSGLEFQNELAAVRPSLSVILITGYGDIAMSVRAMKAGAVEFFAKPFRNQDLLHAIHDALERRRERRKREAELAKLRQRAEALTPRERQVMAQVVRGLMNKQIAANLGLSEATVKAHRGALTRKLAARSVVDLIRMADGIAAAETGDWSADAKVSPGRPRPA
jgi:FixJ family two-component response regulator